MVEIPLLPIPNSPLCPIRIVRLIMAYPGKKHYPLFGVGSRVSFMYNKWQKKFKNLLTKAGYRPEVFSSHSMRHGGVNFAHRNSVSESLIQVHGDWASDCYKQYLTFPIEVRAVLSLKMCEGIIKAGF